MRASGFNDSNSTKVEGGVELPKFIRTLVIETAEEERQLRLFLTGALKVDESGCHSLGPHFSSNALAENPDVSNGSRALANNDSPKVELLTDLRRITLDTKLEIINSLTAIVGIKGNFDAKQVAMEKLRLLVQEL
ncbi:hypothetical protein [Acinetobacter harbinensis]|uniref:hypothetical protein n=1 Tax=Acinetobacter harbinensis TaxID=1353941 RepID=UPI001C4EE029|nr:hypothetical protein [Acinetobacter harbinensis]